MEGRREVRWRGKGEEGEAEREGGDEKMREETSDVLQRCLLYWNRQGIPS